MIWVGIDPGKDGAIVALNESGVQTVPILLRKCVQKRKWNIRRVLDAFAIFAKMNPELVVIEKPIAMPRQSVKSTLETGYGFGILVTAMEAHNIEYEVVTVREWQANVLVGTDAKGKERAIEVAHAIVPELEFCGPIKHSGIADAACLAIHARNQWNERQSKP